MGGEDGKKPLVTRFTKWTRRPGSNTIQKWINKYPNKNVGVVTGPLSGVTVVDIDSADPNVQRAMIERFGDTPLKVRTPVVAVICGIATMAKPAPISAQIFRFKSKHLAELSLFLRVCGRLVSMWAVHTNSLKDHWRISLDSRLLGRGAPTALPCRRQTLHVYEL